MATAGSSPLTTPLSSRLGVTHPIVQAPMAGATTPSLVAAVSRAGGLGMLSGTQLAPDKLRAEIAAIRALTNQPFGVNFLLAGRGPGAEDVDAMQAFLDPFRTELGLPPGPRQIIPPPYTLAEQVEVCLQARGLVLSFAMGDPEAWVQQAKGAGILTMAMATTVADAVSLAEGGVDIIVAQGADAGGHRSLLAADWNGEVPLVGTMALVPQVVDAVPVPVLAAGGIADGRGVAAALALGAQGAMIGTRFLVAEEAGISAAYKAALIEAIETDTGVTPALTGRPARVLRNRLYEALTSAAPGPLAWPLMIAAAFDLYAAAAQRGVSGLHPLYAGQALRMLRQMQPAADILRQLVAETETALAGLPGLPRPQAL